MLLRYIFCLFSFASITCAFDSDPIKLKNVEDRIGVLIINQQPIAFTSLTWRLIFEWNLEPLQSTFRTLQYVYDNLTKTRAIDWEKNAVLHIKESLDDAKNDLELFNSLVQGTADDHTREKRSLPPPDEVIASAITGTTGSFARSIFGVATAEEMDNVHAYLDVLFRRETK